MLDVNDRKFHLYHVLSATGYLSETILLDALTVAPLAFSECGVAVKELLRSRSVSEREPLSRVGL